MIRRLLGREVLRFLLVGGSATLLQMVILALLVEAFAVQAVIGSSVGYGVSAIYNYTINYYLTFASSKPHLETFPKFVLVAGVGALCNAASMAIFLRLGLYYILAQVGATTVTLILNFLLHKYWIYRN